MNPLLDSVAYRQKQQQYAQIIEQMKAAQAVQQQQDAEEQAARSTFAQITQPLIGSAGNIAAGTLGGIGQLGGTAIEALTPWNGVGQNIRNFGTDFRNQISENIEGSPFAVGARPGENSFITNVSSGLGSLGASMGSYGLGRLGGLSRAAASVIPATAFGVNAGGEQAQGAIDAKKSALQALLTGAVAAGAEGGLESFGVRRFAGLPQIGQRMLTEAGQEGAQSLAQSAVRASYDNVNPADAIKQAGTEAFYGGIVGGIGGGGAMMGNQIKNSGVMQDERGTANDADYQQKVDKLEQLTDQDKQTTAGLSHQRTAQPTKYNPMGGVVESGIATRPLSALQPFLNKSELTNFKPDKHRTALTNTGAKMSPTAANTLSRERMKQGESLEKITNFTKKQSDELFKGSPIKANTSIGWGTVREQGENRTSDDPIGMIEAEKAHREYSDDPNAIPVTKAWTSLSSDNIISRATPVVVLDAKVPPKEIGTYYKALTTKAQELGMDAFYDYEYVDPTTAKMGWTDQAKGESIEPAVTLYLKQENNQQLEDILDRHELDEAMISEDGKTIELVNLSHYNENYERFKQNAANAARELSNRGLLDKFQTGNAKVRHIGKSGLAPYSYEQAQSDSSTEAEAVQVAEQPDLTSTIVSRLPTKQYVSKKELEGVINSIPVTTGQSSNTIQQIEKDQALEILDEIDFEPRALLPNQKSGQIRLGQFVAKMRESMIKTEMTTSNTHSDYGISKLDRPFGKSKTFHVNVKNVDGFTGGHMSSKTGRGELFWFRGFEDPKVNPQIRMFESRLKDIDETVQRLKERMSGNLGYSEDEYNAMTDDEKLRAVTSLKEQLAEYGRRRTTIENNFKEAKQKQKQMAVGKAVLNVVEVQSDAFQQGQYRDAKDPKAQEAQRVVDRLQRDIKTHTESIKDIRNRIDEQQKNIKKYDALIKELKQPGGGEDKAVGNLFDRATVKNPNIVIMPNSRMDAGRRAISSKRGAQESIDDYSDRLNRYQEQREQLVEKIKEANKELKEAQQNKDKTTERLYAQLKAMQGTGETDVGRWKAKTTNYRRRVLNELLVKARDAGYKELNFPTVSTVAKIEYNANVDDIHLGGDPMPYTDASGDAIDRDTELVVGDEIEYNDNTQQVIDVQGETVYIAEPDDIELVDTYRADELMSEDIDSRLDEAQYELRTELEAGITPEHATELREATPDSWEASQILERIEEAEEIINEDNVESIIDKVREDMYQSSDFDIDMYFPEHTHYGEVDGNQVYVANGDYSNVYQPNNYDPVVDEISQSDLDFKFETGRKFAEQNEGKGVRYGVLRNYYEFMELLKKLEKENDVRIEYVNDDGYGNSWFRVHLNKAIKTPTF